MNNGERVSTRVMPSMLLVGLFMASSSISATAYAQSAEGANAAPVPAAIKERGELHVGVRCDVPSSGTLDSNRVNVGFEPDMARKMAEYTFGDQSKVVFTCVTAESRIPFLTSERVDFVIATLGKTPDREKVIDFSNAYNASYGQILTKADAPAINDIQEATGKMYLTLSGTPYVEFASKCLESPDVRQFKTLSDAVADLMNDRGFGVIHDNTALGPIVAKNSKVKINGPDLEIGFSAAIGVRKGESDMVNWLNGLIDRMQKEDVFTGLVDRNYPEEQRNAMYSVIRTPDNTPAYDIYTGTANCE